MKHLIVDVNLWKKNIGSLVWDYEKEVASFEYASKFLASGLEVSPVTMPLRESGEVVYQFLENKNRCFHGLPGLIADALPDAFGSQIISEWFATQGMPEETITPLDRLCYVGQRAMGALEFMPTKTIKGLNTSSQIQIDELTALADDVFKRRTEFQGRLRAGEKKILDILKVGTSAGGAKPKAIIAYNEQTGEVRSGQVKAPENFTYWLLKFDGGTYSENSHITENPKGIGNIEYAYYLMAKDAGINMMECRLLSEGDSSHFMTKRFDRMDNGEKLHIQTLAGIAHYDRDKRYSYEQAFRIMRTLNLPKPQEEEFFRRMVFNVVTRNHDDHTKNHSFTMNQSGEWSLSPAYDVCYSYSPGGRWTDKHQMSINSKVDNFTFEDLQSIAKKMSIRNSREIIERVVCAASKWAEFAKDAGVREKHLEQINANLLLLEPQKRTDADNYL